jgi:hypothetical protein
LYKHRPVRIGVSHMISNTYAWCSDLLRRNYLSNMVDLWQETDLITKISYSTKAPFIKSMDHENGVKVMWSGCDWHTVIHWIVTPMCP